MVFEFQFGRFYSAYRQIHHLPDAGAPGFSQTVSSRTAHRNARTVVSAGAGIRLSRTESGRRTWRNRPEIQPARWARASTRLRAAFADRVDHADPRRSGWRAKD